VHVHHEENGGVQENFRLEYAAKMPSHKRPFVLEYAVVELVFLERTFVYN
jgi:hypothetical protein